MFGDFVIWPWLRAISEFSECSVRFKRSGAVGVLSCVSSAAFTGLSGCSREY